MFAPSKKKIGMLGGGQLGRMMIQEGLPLGLEIHTLDPDPNAPCASCAKSFTIGSLSDFNSVYAFGKTMDVLTIEIEHVNTKALHKLSENGVEVYPQPQILETIQDKGQQKIFFRLNKIPTSPFVLTENKSDIKNHLPLLPFFQKLRKGGYDGKGVKLIRSEKDIDDAFNLPSVLEQFVEIQSEISVITARNKSGEIKTFPAVECQFNAEANLVEFLFSPARINESIISKATKLAIEITEKLNIVGLLAVEMFVTKKGEVLVNELAPRPHNSGHHTLKGNVTSQFEQHLRAILSLPLGDTSISFPSVMINLLGEKNNFGESRYVGLEEALKMKGVHLQLYGKNTVKPFRKMGHITVTGNTLEEAMEKASLLKNKVFCMGSETRNTF